MWCSDKISIRACKGSWVLNNFFSTCRIDDINNHIKTLFNEIWAFEKLFLLLSHWWHLITVCNYRSWLKSDIEACMVKKGAIKTSSSDWCQEAQLFCARLIIQKKNAALNQPAHYSNFEFRWKALYLKNQKGAFQFFEAQESTSIKFVLSKVPSFYQHLHLKLISLHASETPQILSRSQVRTWFALRSPQKILSKGTAMTSELQTVLAQFIDRWLVLCFTRNLDHSKLSFNSFIVRWDGYSMFSWECSRGFLDSFAFGVAPRVQLHREDDLQVSKNVPGFESPPRTFKIQNLYYRLVLV